MATLFDKGSVGSVDVQNRVFMAPLTRSRAVDGTDVPSDMAVTYYQQRASGGLLITEASQISPQGKGYIRTPGIYSAEQVQK